LTSEKVCTKQARIAELAQKLPGRQMTSLNHYIDLDWMQEACRRTRKDAAPGVDGVEWEEYSHFGMISRLQAGAAGLPFIPMNQTAATDLEHNNPNIRRVRDPYTGKEVITVPPLHPDVAIIHMQRADKNGNAHIWGIIGEQKEVAFAAKNVIITAEEIVDESVIRSDPNRTLIPELIVSAVCHVPHCAHPSYTQGYYDRDNVFYLNWDKISEDPAAVKAWLDEWVYGVKDADEYWQKLGNETHQRLSVKPHLAFPVDYGEY